MGYDPINKLPHIQRMNSLRGDPVNLDGSKINIQDKELTPDKIKRAVSSFWWIMGSLYNLEWDMILGKVFWENVPVLIAYYMVISIDINFKPWCHNLGSKIYSISSCLNK